MVLVCPGGLPETPIDTYGGRWWLVHTKPRNEKALSADLNKLGVDHFLPLVNVRRRYSGRTVELRLPLFPSYLFMCGDEEARYTTLCTHRVVHLIGVADQEGIRKELHNVFRVTVSTEPVDLYPALKRGRRCRVIGGPLIGLEGIVLRRRDICRVYVGVEVLGQSAEVEIDPSLLEAIE